MCRGIYFFLTFFFVNIVYAQQNSSQSISISKRRPLIGGINFSTTASRMFSLNKTSLDSNFFRGNNVGLFVKADYFFSHWGIGITSGFSSGKPDQSTISKWLTQNNIS